MDDTAFPIFPFRSHFILDFRRVSFPLPHVPNLPSMTVYSRDPPSELDCGSGPGHQAEDLSLEPSGHSRLSQGLLFLKLSLMQFGMPHSSFPSNETHSPGKCHTSHLSSG